MRLDRDSPSLEVDFFPAKAVQAIAPFGPIAQTDGIMVAIGKPKSQQEPSRGVRSEGVDQLLVQQPHRGSAENDNALLVKANDPLVGTEIQNFGEMEFAA